MLGCLTPAPGFVIYVNVINIHMRAACRGFIFMEALVHPVAYLNEIPRPFWIGGMVLAFIWHWPIGLAVLAFLIGSGRIGRRWNCGPGRWYNAPGQTQPQSAAQWCSGWGKWGNGSADASPAHSGNQAFDDYRAETLRRLEDEQREFVDYLERLRRAKDKAEFDQFMADRRRPPAPQEPQNPN